MTDREKAERALREAGFEQSRLTSSTWLRGTERDSIDMCAMQDDGLFDLGMAGKHADLPALLAPRLTDDEREALSWAETTAHLMAGRTITADSKQLAQRHANTLQALLARLGGGDVDAG